MKTLKHLIFVLLVFILIIGSTACMEISDESSANINQISEASSSPGISELSERNVVEAVWNRFNGTDDIWDGKGYDYIGECMEYAEKFYGKLLGSISTETEAIEKCRAAYIDHHGYAESEYEQYVHPFEAEFYEEYGVWIVNEIPPSGYIDSNGKKIPPPPSSQLYYIIRSSDGKVLAVLLN